MVLNSLFSRYLEQVSDTSDNTDPSLIWSNTTYRIMGIFMFSLGIFLLFQGYPKRRIVHIIVPYFLAYSLFGNDLFTSKDFTMESMGIVKLIGVGSLLAGGSYFYDGLGYVLMGLLTGFFALMIPSFQIARSVTSVIEFVNDHPDFAYALVLLGGPLIGFIFRDRIMIYLSILTGAFMFTTGIAAIWRGQECLIFLNSHGIILFLIEIVGIIAGYFIQTSLKKEEEKVNEELGMAQEYEESRRLEGIANRYQNINKA